MRQLRGFNRPTNTLPPNPMMDEAMKKYGNLDEDALVEKLFSQIASQKANGTYDAKQMKGFIEMLSPHISVAQKTKLEKIVSVIEKENE